MMALRSATLLAMITLPAMPGYAANEIHDYLRQPWYATEVIIFQRPQVMEFNTVERLANDHPTALPAGIRTLAGTGEMNMVDRLDPLARASLAFPTLSVREEVIPDHEQSAPVAEPAWPRGSAPPPIHPHLEPHPLLDFMAAVGEFEDGLPAHSLRWLPADTMTLGAEFRRLQREPGYQLLFHGRWLQPVPSRDAPEPVFIQAGMDLKKRFQLEGTVGVTLGRYLHFRADLTYTEPGLGLRPIYLPSRADGTALQVPIPPANAAFMVLSESRRMRSDETHYLDHPKLGVIVRVEHVPFPDDLVALFEALQEAAD